MDMVSMDTSVYVAARKRTGWAASFLRLLNMQNYLVAKLCDLVVAKNLHLSVEKCLGNACVVLMLTAICLVGHCISTHTGDFHNQR